MKDIHHDAKKEFWDAMEDISGGMLGLEGDALVPMTPMVRDDAHDGKIWFITAEGTDLHNAVKSGPKGARLVVADQSEGLWADIHGTLSAEDNPQIVKDIWTPVAGAWFEDGQEDADVRLMCFAPREAEATITDDNPVRFFYEIAKAKVTEQKPDLGGWKGKITF